MFELQDCRYSTVSYGNRETINHMVKHQMADGRYRIVGPQLELYCIRRNGVVYPDPERVPLRRLLNFQEPALQYVG